MPSQYCTQSKTGLTSHSPSISSKIGNGYFLQQMADFMPDFSFSFLHDFGACNIPSPPSGAWHTCFWKHSTTFPRDTLFCSEFRLHHASCGFFLRTHSWKWSFQAFFSYSLLIIVLFMFALKVSVSSHVLGKNSVQWSQWGSRTACYWGKYFASVPNIVFLIFKCLSNLKWKKALVRKSVSNIMLIIPSRKYTSLRNSCRCPFNKFLWILCYKFYQHGFLLRYYFHSRLSWRRPFMWHRPNVRKAKYHNFVPSQSNISNHPANALTIVDTQKLFSLHIPGKFILQQSSTKLTIIIHAKIDFISYPRKSHLTTKLYKTSHHHYPMHSAFL